MSVKLSLAAAVFALGLGACSSGPTPYQRGDGWERGYADTRIETNRYRISFKGNSLTSKETVENYLLFRAAELTVQNGYDTFTIVSRDTDKDRRVSSAPRMSIMTFSYFVPRYGWVYDYQPYWTDGDYREVTRYEASAEILMSKGPKSSDPNAFDARDVVSNLGRQISRPEG